MSRLAQVAVGIGAGTLVYTAPSQFHADVRDILIANTSATSIRFTLHLVPPSDTPSAGNVIFPSVVVPANTLIQWTGDQTIQPGGFLQAIGTALGITVTVNGEVAR